MKFALVMLFKKSTREEDIFEDKNQNKNILSITVKEDILITVKEDILPIKIKDWYFPITIKSCANVIDTNLDIRYISFRWSHCLLAYFYMKIRNCTKVIFTIRSVGYTKLFKYYLHKIHQPLAITRPKFQIYSYVECFAKLAQETRVV